MFIYTYLWCIIMKSLLDIAWYCDHYSQMNIKKALSQKMYSFLVRKVIKSKHLLTIVSIYFHQPCIYFIHLGRVVRGNILISRTYERAVITGGCSPYPMLSLHYTFLFSRKPFNGNVAVLKGEYHLYKIFLLRFRMSTLRKMKH